MMEEIVKNSPVSLCVARIGQIQEMGDQLGFGSTEPDTHSLAERRTAEQEYFVPQLMFGSVTEPVL